MLFKSKILKKIADGEVTIAFRKWNRPSVKTNGTLKTSVGLLKIMSVEKVLLSHVTQSEIEKAGYTCMTQLEAELNMKKEGQIYCISFQLTGPDPRIELRETTDLSANELDVLIQKLEKWNSNEQAPIKNWVYRIFLFLYDEPGGFARHYAAKLNVEKEWLKTNMRKLKNLGLTISEGRGYTLSKRGVTVLKFWIERNSNLENIKR